jgi:hypothetical protein
VLPTDAAPHGRYSLRMTEKYVFADVDLPFHVWVKEGGRWVLRHAASDLQGAGASCRAEPANPAAQRPESPRS